MDFLSKLDFTDQEIKLLNDCVPDLIKELIKENQKLVVININYLKNLGIKNYREVFMKFFDLFLLDASTFKDIFDKYETEDLINKIQENVGIVEFL